MMVWFIFSSDIIFVGNELTLSFILFGSVYHHLLSPLSAFNYCYLQKGWHFFLWHLGSRGRCAWLSCLASETLSSVPKLQQQTGTEVVKRNICFLHLLLGWIFLNQSIACQLPSPKSCFQTASSAGAFSCTPSICYSSSHLTVMLVRMAFFFSFFFFFCFWVVLVFFPLFPLLLWCSSVGILQSRWGKRRVWKADRNVATSLVATHSIYLFLFFAFCKGKEEG